MSQLVDCNLERHGDAILALFNHAIETSAALYDYHPRPKESMPPWFAAKRQAELPVIGAESEDGVLMGFATYGPFRPHAAYQYSVEHSVYVNSEYRGQGLGRRLLYALIERAKQQDYHLLIGVIDSQNQASIRLHQRMGFTHSGTLSQVGFKFGRWLDVDLYQLALDTPRQPRSDRRRRLAP